MQREAPLVGGMLGTAGFEVGGVAEAFEFYARGTRVSLLQSIPFGSPGGVLASEKENTDLFD